LPTQIHVNFRFVRKDGTIIWLKTVASLERDPASGQPVGFYGCTMIRREVAPEIVEVDAGDTRFAKLGCVGGRGGEGM
jgi:hypothetical protein